MLRLKVLILTLIFCFRIHCEVEFERQDIDGQMLIDLGRQQNNTFLTIVGMAITNYHQCDWSQWTPCSTRFQNVFGMKTRSRLCGLGNGRRTETEKVLCEGTVRCPDGYNVTENGICMKLYKTKKSRDEAEAACNGDGGFLLNIDSDAKYEDVKTILNSTDVRVNEFHINGRRKSSTSQWEYTYGSARDLITWFISYPVNTASYVCLYMTGMRSTPKTRFLWYNNRCDARVEFFCEIVG